MLRNLILSFLTKLGLAAALSLSLVVGVCAEDNGKTVHFLNWAEYIPDDILSGFTTASGYTIQQNYFDSDDMLNAEIIAVNSGYDLALPSLDTMQQEVAAGVLMPLDKSQLPNYKYINPALYKITAEIDPDNKYGIIYDYGTTGIAYNVDIIKKVLGPDVKIDSWYFLLNPKYLKKLQTCGVAYLDDSGQVLGITLHYLGMDPNTTNPADLRKATAYIMSIRPYLTYFDNTRYIADLASGNICIAMGYSGDVLHAQQQADQANDNVHIQYVLPKDGAPIWFDMLAIPKDAPNPKGALAFINYLLEPKVAADLSNFLYQPGGNAAALPYLEPVLSDPNISPPPEMMGKLFDVLKPPPGTDTLISE